MCAMLPMLREIAISCLSGPHCVVQEPRWPHRLEKIGCLKHAHNLYDRNDHGLAHLCECLLAIRKRETHLFLCQALDKHARPVRQLLMLSFREFAWAG